MYQSDRVGDFRVRSSLTGNDEFVPEELFYPKAYTLRSPLNRIHYDAIDDPADIGPGASANYSFRVRTSSPSDEEIKVLELPRYFRNDC